jgi:hypothetical protein
MRKDMGRSMITNQNSLHEKATNFTKNVTLAQACTALLSCAPIK